MRVPDRKELLLVLGGIALAVAAVGAPTIFSRKAQEPQENFIVVSSPFIYSFNAPGVLQEAGAMGDSTSPYWWLNSGGELILSNGLGETMQGDAPLINKWRIAYSLSNPLDTDNGVHPQNLFRLVSKSTWNDVILQAQFYIAADNFSASPNRNQSNGLLLMSRYHTNGQTLYYAGVRVDGTAIIKKKINGVYYTLAQKQVFSGTYSMQGGGGTSRNLLPHKQWIGLKSETLTNANGSVSIVLWMQLPGGAWQKLLSAVDAGGSSVGGTAPISGANYAGIRTDFMDVQFAHFQATEL